MTDRVKQLEELLAEAYKELRWDLPLRQRIAAAMPTDDPREHATYGGGETRCGDRLDVLPRPRLAPSDDAVTCTDCVEAFIKDKRRDVALWNNAVTEAYALLARIRGAT